MSVPEGSALQPPNLPSVSQPLTLWDWLWRLWWLWLILLLLLLLLLWWLWRKAQPWGEGDFISAPDSNCQNSTKPLKGPVDVGKLFGEERLEGVKLVFQRGRVYLERTPENVRVKQSGLSVEEGDHLEWGEKITFQSPDKKELGTLTIRKR